MCYFFRHHSALLEIESSDCTMCVSLHNIAITSSHSLSDKIVVKMFVLLPFFGEEMKKKKNIPRTHTAITHLSKTKEFQPKNKSS